jgi:hypothetical protein
MITTRKICQLDLVEPVQPGRPSYLGAASGLVHIGDRLYLVADDENHIAVFDDHGSKPGTLLRVFEGDLPLDKKSRKKSKPDLEALARLSHPVHAPTGALLLVPSGSKSHRNRGALINLDRNGHIDAAPRELDFTPLLACLPFDPPNLEAAVMWGSNLCLLNRGNKKNQPNALLLFDLGEILEALLGGTKLRCSHTRAIDIGLHEGVPFTFTDASLVENQLVFTAAAESTQDSYEDGPTGAAGIGVLSADGKIISFKHVSPANKLEGISARRQGNQIRCLLVNDEDDPTIPSSLLECFIPL